MSAAYASLPQCVPRAAAPSPLVLTNRELVAEAGGLALRIAHSDLPARDAMLVLQLAERLRRSA